MGYFKAKKRVYPNSTTAGAIQPATSHSNKEDRDVVQQKYDTPRRTCTDDDQDAMKMLASGNRLTPTGSILFIANYSISVM